MVAPHTTTGVAATASSASPKWSVAGHMPIGETSGNIDEFQTKSLFDARTMWKSPSKPWSRYGQTLAPFAVIY
ncbi:hypothetical protein BGZ79_006770 [Entomortierella chlamydospora]|nr:hypothetical protein BGZ79_006770 [Entomortierella chlamydospora]